MSRYNQNPTMSLSDAIKTSANNMLFETLLNNPDKRAKVLELLTQEGIVGSDGKSSPNSTKLQKYNSPIKRLYKNDSVLNKTPKSKTNSVRLESPSALCRRRALQRLESDSSVEEIPQKPTSPPFVGTPKPFDQLLEGVVAYCEIRSNGEDRSASIKTMMQSMGAKVKDNLCRGVTHVVLKDGLYTTFRKAKLLKIHVVSVLWLEAVRRHMFKVPEEKFPAVCADAYQANLTQICQEIQEDYNDVIQEELEKTHNENRRRSETPKSYITERKKSVKSRTTIYGANCSSHKKPHNRTEIASPYKHKLYEPELSESDSYISVGSNSNKSVDIVPSSQDVVTLLPAYQITNPNSTKVSEEEPEDVLPESNIAKHVKDSFELKKAAKIRSPESLSRSRQKTVVDNLQHLSLEEESSLRLHVSTEESNSNNTNLVKSSSTSMKNNLEYSANEKSGKSTESLHLHLSSDSNSNCLGKNNTNSTTNSNGDNKFKTKKQSTAGLKRPPKKNLPSESNQDNNISSKSIEIPIQANIVINEVKRKTRRNTIFKSIDSSNSSKETTENQSNITDDKTKSNLEINESYIKTRRKSLANIFTENKTNPEITDDESIENRTKNLESNENLARKTRRKTLANIFMENKVQDDTDESNDRTKSDLGIGDNNVSKKTRRKTFAVDKNKCENDENNLNIEEKQNIRKSSRKTMANSKIEKPKQNNEIEEAKTSSDSSPDKTKRRVRKLFDPNQAISASHINWDEEVKLNPVPLESPAKKSKFRVPVPKILSAKAGKKTKSTIKSPAKSVPTKPSKTIVNNKRKSVRALNFDSSSSEDTNKPNNIHVPSRRSERIAKTPSKNFKLPDSTTDSEKSQTSTEESQKSDKNKLFLTPKVPISAFKKKSQKSSSSEKRTPKRRSTLDFRPQKTLEEIKSSQKTKQPSRVPSIVCTRLHKSDVQVFQQIVKKLGGFIIEDEVTKRTTHLVAGGPARTVNMLRAIVRGCWVLRHEWLLKSLEAGKWLEEEDFEMIEFSPTVQRSGTFLKKIEKLLEEKE